METLKVLGQVVPSGVNTLTTLYTVPALTTAVVSTLVICNTTNASITYRVKVVINGAADALKQYLFYDVILTKKNSQFATIGITLGANDSIAIYADSVSVSFQVFGTELT